MSAKTIEVVSPHIGPVKFTLRNGETRTVQFEDKAGIGFALVDEDEANHLLGEIGAPDFMKPGAGEAPVEIGDQNGAGEDTGTTIDVLTKENYGQVKDANALKKLLKACDDKALLMDLVATETQSETPRETWSKALNARLVELAE